MLNRFAQRASVLLITVVLQACGGGQVPLEPGVTGRVDSFPDFASAFVAARNVDVWVPPGYDSTEVDYAVLYMHDGQNLFDPSLSYIGVDWGMDEAMTAIIDSTGVAGALIVGIWNTPKRTQEYMPAGFAERYTPDEREEYMAGVGEWPLSDVYLRFVVEELKPFIDSRYRTKTDAAHTSTMGSSMGGLISLYALTEYPEIFGSAGCVSTHWPIARGTALSYLEEHLPNPGANRIYFDFGTETLDSQYEPYQTQVDSLMLARGYQQGVDWTTRKFEGDDHSERSWRARIHIPLHFLLAED